MKSYIFEGKTKEEALELAISELNLKDDDLILSYKEEKRGLFKGTIYILTVYKKEDIASYIKELLVDIIYQIGMDVKVEIIFKDNQYKFSLVTDNKKLLIGRNGRTIDSLRTIIKQILINNNLDSFYFSIDVDGYKQRQRDYLIRDVKKLAEEVCKTKQEIVLDPLNSYERRIVHKALSDLKDIYTESEGEGKDRRLIIKPKL